MVIAPTVEDTAEYDCVVSNEAGEEARAIQLTVQGEYLQYGRPSEHRWIVNQLINQPVGHRCKQYRQTQTKRKKWIDGS